MRPPVRGRRRHLRSQPSARQRHHRLHLQQLPSAALHHQLAAGGRATAGAGRRRRAARVHAQLLPGQHRLLARPRRGDRRVRVEELHHSVRAPGRADAAAGRAADPRAVRQSDHGAPDWRRPGLPAAAEGGVQSGRDAHHHRLCAGRPGAGAAAAGPRRENAGGVPALSDHDDGRACAGLCRAEVCGGQHHDGAAAGSGQL